MCLWGAPSPVYKGVEEGEGQPSMARPGGVLLPPGVGFPPSLVGLGKGESYSYSEEDSSPPWRALGPAGLPLAPLYTGAGGTLGHTS